MSRWSKPFIFRPQLCDCEVVATVDLDADGHGRSHTAQLVKVNIGIAENGKERLLDVRDHKDKSVKVEHDPGEPFEVKRRKTLKTKPCHLHAQCGPNLYKQLQAESDMANRAARFIAGRTVERSPDELLVNASLDNEGVVRVHLGLAPMFMKRFQEAADVEFGEGKVIFV